MNKKLEKTQIKKELKRLFKSMDFVCNNYLNNEGVTDKELKAFANIYQQLGLAWEYIGLQCRHWDGYKKTRNKKEVCKICGKVRDIDDTHVLMPTKGHKKLGRKIKPTSKNTFRTKKEAQILNDSIDFHGARLDINVHNSYKSKLFQGDLDINIAAERIVKLRESGIECSIGGHRIDIRVGPPKQKGSKPDYGNFAFELKKKDLKYFPVIFNFDDNFKFSGLTILRQDSNFDKVQPYLERIKKEAIETAGKV